MKPDAESLTSPPFRSLKVCVLSATHFLPPRGIVFFLLMLVPLPSLLLDAIQNLLTAHAATTFDFGVFIQNILWFISPKYIMNGASFTFTTIVLIKQAGTEAITMQNFTENLQQDLNISVRSQKEATITSAERLSVEDEVKGVAAQLQVGNASHCDSPTPIMSDAQIQV